MAPYLRLALTAALILPACQEHAEVSLTPGQQKKVQAHLLSAAPTPKTPIGAVIENQVRLIGVDVDKTTVKPGDTVTVTYYLEALAEKPDDTMIFVHFQGRKNDRAAWQNLDHHPIEGLYPLRQFKKGQWLKDVHRFTVKPDFSGGEAKIYWGLFRGNYRLKISNADKVPSDDENRVIVATLMVEGAKLATPSRSLPTATTSRLRPGESLTVDGKLDEPVWGRARWTPHWTSPDGKNGPAPKTRAKFAWDDAHLYVAVAAEDDDIWSTFTERDSNTWEQEVIEIFIDADGDRKDYLELQVTPANVVFDARFAAHRSDLAAARAWNMEGFKTAVQVDGTLNQRDDKDRGYTIEMAIPIAEVPGAAKTPAVGARWLVNLFRWDLPKDGRQRAAAWSPPIRGDFHALDRFGALRFVDGPSAPTKLGPITPTGHPIIDARPIKLDPAKLKRLKLGQKAVEAPAPSQSPESTAK